MKYFYFVIIFILLAAFGFFAYKFIFIGPQDIKKTTAMINGRSFSIEIADTVSKQMQGLSGREKLNENEGMLFIFKDSSIRSFWMKGMNFPIDIIWIREGEIVEFSENLQPSGSLLNAFKDSVSPSVPVNYVLEVAAGTVERFGIKAGDKISINSNN
jgi:hypothetical protein